MSRNSMGTKITKNETTKAASATRTEKIARINVAMSAMLTRETSGCSPKTAFSETPEAAVSENPTLREREVLLLPSRRVTRTSAIGSNGLRCSLR